MEFLYIIWQCTWGVLQTLLGLVLLLFNVKKKKYFYKGAIVVLWDNQSSLSLGMFVFITKKPYFYEKLKNDFTEEELFSRLLVHEYGHTIQSLILGPLYLLIMGIPSTIWGFLPYYNKKRQRENISYFAFFTEKWANRLGEKVLKEKSMEYLII